MGLFLVIARCFTYSDRNSVKGGKSEIDAVIRTLAVSGFRIEGPRIREESGILCSSRDFLNPSAMALASFTGTSKKTDLWKGGKFKDSNSISSRLYI